jgi:LCP family protein required for cell wall assembly
MASPTRRRLLAAALSMIAPGAGQLYSGARRRGIVLISVTAALVVLAGALAAHRALPSLDRRLLLLVLAVDLAVLGFRLFAVVDAWRVGGTATAAAVLGLAALAALTVAPHVGAAYVSVRSYEVLDDVFADEAPRDVLPSRGVFLARPALREPPEPVDPAPPSKPLAGSRTVLAGDEPAAERTWTTILLLGTDEGPGNWGARTDTIILAALEHGTGRAALFGVPRNLVEIPLPEKAARASNRFREPINELYGYARSRPELFPGGRDPGATALKQAVSLLLDVRVDYYGLVNLRGFADLVDALGGVDIRVGERLHDEVTRPAWGEPKPKIDVFPGRTYHMYGREALAYVRSRKDSNDYTRMARQRCFLSAMANQFDVVRALRHFGTLARTIQDNVHTDVPLDRVPGLLRLVAGVDPRKTLTQTFGLDYFFARRAADDFPAPHLGRMRATVRAVLLDPTRAQRSNRVAVTQQSC